MTAKRTVEDTAGNRYLLLKESAESSLVRDPASGETAYLPNEQIERITSESPLETATRGVPAKLRTLLVSVPDERALGLLFEIDDGGPVAVRTLLSAYDLCESDLHGLLAEFRAAGLVAETTVAGERGYETTELATAGLAALRANTD